MSPRVTRWLVTGASGQLGTELRQVLAGAQLRALGRAELDLTDSAAVQAEVELYRPEVIVNAAAYTAVDAAEENEQLAHLSNAGGPALLAAAAGRVGARLVHVSTDYVFAGDGTRPYEPDDVPDPRSAYGRSKLAGELAVREVLPEASYVVRTAWVYGASGANFVKTMARLERERETVSVVDDQRGSPTWAADLARGLVELASSAAPAGIYHCTNGGDTTWYGLARAVFEELGADPDRVQPTTTAVYPRPAPRPAYSVLSSHAWTAAGLTPLPDWRDALARAFAESGAALRAS